MNGQQTSLTVESGRSADQVIVERLIAGDADAFASLVAKYQATMVRVAMAYVKSRSVAQEVVQDTWLSILSGIRRFEGRSSLKNWMFRILTNRAKTRGVREARTIPMSAMRPADDSERGSDHSDHFGADGYWNRPARQWKDSPEQRYYCVELRKQIDAAVATLPPRQRVVVQMRDIEGQRGSEISQALSISEANQRVLLHRGRAKVRALLGRDTLQLALAS